MTTMPPHGDCSPKKTAVHRKLSAIWIAHHTVGRASVLARQASQPAMAMAT